MKNSVATIILSGKVDRDSAMLAATFTGRGRGLAGELKKNAKSNHFHRLSREERAERQKYGE